MKSGKINENGQNKRKLRYTPAAEGQIDDQKKGSRDPFRTSQEHRFIKNVKEQAWAVTTAAQARKHACVRQNPCAKNKIPTKRRC